MNTKRVCLFTLLRHENHLSLLEKMSSPKLQSAPLRTVVMCMNKLFAVTSWRLVTDLVPTPRLGTLSLSPSPCINCGPQWLTSAPPNSATTLPYLPSSFIRPTDSQVWCHRFLWASLVNFCGRCRPSNNRADPSLPPTRVVQQHISPSDRLLARAPALFLNATCTAAPSWWVKSPRRPATLQQW